MKLPNAHLAIVEQEKVVEYLLNPAHPDNGGKAAFFRILGFDREDWSVFATALRKLRPPDLGLENIGVFARCRILC